MLTGPRREPTPQHANPNRTDARSEAVQASERQESTPLPPARGLRRERVLGTDGSACRCNHGTRTRLWPKGVWSRRVAPNHVIYVTMRTTSPETCSKPVHRLDHEFGRKRARHLFQSWGASCASAHWIPEFEHAVWIETHRSSFSTCIMSQDSVITEKNILFMTNSDFIIRLYET